jgi:hypothetical protein
MKTKLSILLTAIAGGVISAMPAQAASFGTGGISFDEDTNVVFEFDRSFGRYKTDLRVYEVVNGAIGADLGLLFGEVKAADSSSGEFSAPDSEPVGTLGNAVVEYNNSFTFEAGKEYTLGIVNYGHWQNKDTGSPLSTMYSTTTLNDDGTQRAVFGSTGGEELLEFDDASLFQEQNPFAGWVGISFEDGGNNNDMDFQDFTFRATASEEFGGGVLSESTPEPATLAGLGIVAGGMFLSRRKKQK